MQIRALGASLLLLSASVGCSGDDARKCKVEALDSGDVRVSCPGSAAITVPAGREGSGEIRDCQVLPSTDGRTSEIVCGEEQLTLRLCGGGLKGYYGLGDFDPDLLEQIRGELGDFDTDLEARVLQDKCTIVEGLVLVSDTLGASAREALSALTHVENLRFIGGSGSLELPNLFSSHVEVVSDANQWTSLRFEGLEIGGITVGEGASVEDLYAWELREGYVRLVDADVPAIVKFPKLESGDVMVWRARGLEMLSLPALRYASMVSLNESAELSDVELSALELTNQLDIIDLPLLTALYPTALKQAGSIRVSQIPQMQALAFDRLESAGSIELFATASLEEFAAPLLRAVTHNLSFTQSPKLESVALPLVETVGGELAFTDSAGDVLGGLGLYLSSLRSVGTLEFGSSYITAFRAPDLVTIHSGALTILNADSLLELIVPRLSRASVHILSLADATAPRLLVDLSQVDLVPGEDDPSAEFSVKVFASGGRPLEVFLENASISGSLEIIAPGLVGPLVIGPGVVGGVGLRSILQPAMLNLANATGMTSLEMTGVGNDIDRWAGVVNSSHLTSVLLQSVALDGFQFTVAENATVTIEGHLARGDLRYVAPEDATVGRRFDLTVTSSVNGIPMGPLAKFDDIDLSAMVSGSVSFQEADGTRLLLGNFISGSVTAHLPNLSELDLSRMSSGVVDIYSLKLNPARFYVSAAPQTDLLGLVEANWVGAPCPASLLGSWPEVDFSATGCTP